MCSEEGHRKYRNNGPPLYELNEELISDMKKILEKKYGITYRMLLDARKSFDNEPRSEYFESMTYDLFDQK